MSELGTLPAERVELPPISSRVLPALSHDLAGEGLEDTVLALWNTLHDDHTALADALLAAANRLYPEDRPGRMAFMAGSMFVYAAGVRTNDVEALASLFEPAA